jgi:hypothetical protein
VEVRACEIAFTHASVSPIYVGQRLPCGDGPEREAEKHRLIPMLSPDRIRKVDDCDNSKTTAAGSSNTQDTPNQALPQKAGAILAPTSSLSLGAAELFRSMEEQK